MDRGKNEHVKRMLTTADTASGREDAAKRTRNALSPINFSPTPRKLASPLWTRANVKSMISITTCTSTNSIIKWRGLVTHTRLWMWGALPAAVVIARYILDAYCSWQQGDKYTSLDIVIMPWWVINYRWKYASSYPIREIDTSANCLAWPLQTR